MKPFKYIATREISEATTAYGVGSPSFYLGGGTNLIDLARLNVESPELIVDINALPLAQIERTKGGGLNIGALVRNSDLAYHPHVVKYYPVLSEALLSGASPQLRNMATVGGNLLQRTRCPYFNDVAFNCNKRLPNSGCPAINGYNRNLAVLGTSNHCIATNPSDMNVALAALDPVIEVEGPTGLRRIQFADFHLLPQDTPHIETSLKAGELITHVIIPPMPFARRSLYIKVRDRASYEFALTSAAVILDLSDNKIRGARIALGGVGTKPWRAKEAEDILAGAAPTPSNFAAAAEAALKKAKASKYNGFKIELAKRTIIRALTKAGEISL